MIVHAPFIQRHSAACRAAVKNHWCMFLVLVWGITLRLLYFSSTTHAQRSYDSAAHLDYIRYVLTHGGIPAASTGWEMHQPPLYYFLTWSWIKSGLLLGRMEETLILDLQILSLVLSILTFCVILWIGRILFPEPKQRLHATAFVFVVSTLPGIVMFATRINNDVLAVLLSFLWCAFALRWWKDGRPQDFWIAAVLIGFGMLTKFNTGMLAFPMLLFVFLRRRIGIKQKMLHAGGLFCVIGLLSGWYFLFRSFEYFHQLATTGAAGGMHRTLLMTNHPLDFVIFNPAAIIEMPFTSPWDVFPGRQYFWEYLFRSAFFGEWAFANLLWLSRAMVAAALVGIVAGIRGIVRGWREREFALPLAILASTLLAMLFAYRAYYPCACNQDFRFVPLIVVPAVAWAFWGFCEYGERGLRWMLAWAIALALFQSGFLLSVSYGM